MLFLRRTCLARDSSLFFRNSRNFQLFQGWSVLSIVFFVYSWLLPVPPVSFWVRPRFSRISSCLDEICSSRESIVLANTAPSPLMVSSANESSYILEAEVNFVWVLGGPCGIVPGIHVSLAALVVPPFVRTEDQRPQTVPTKK